ncbi:hypothetical protein GCM10027262_55920 [Nocardia tengchongensis]
MPNLNSRAKLRGTLAAAALLTGLTVGEGAAVAAPADVQPAASTGSASASGTMSAEMVPVINDGSAGITAGSADAWSSSLLGPTLQMLFGCGGHLVSNCPPGTNGSF